MRCRMHHVCTHGTVLLIFSSGHKTSYKGNFIILDDKQKHKTKACEQICPLAFRMYAHGRTKTY